MARRVIFQALFLFSAILHGQTLTVAAASNLKYALDDISREFTKDTGITVKPIFGSSGKLTQQIMSGAPYDLFLSADVEYPAKLSANGYTLTKPTVYVYGTLVLWSANKTPLEGGIVSLCANPNITIAIANPKTAPYGSEALNVLRYYKLDQSCRAKIVTAESISQVGNYVTSKSADIGFIAKSIILSDEMRKIGEYKEIESKAYQPIDQAMVILKSAPRDNYNAAKLFFDYVRSPKAQAIFKTNGYTFSKSQ